MEEVSALCRQWKVPLIVDASQSAGLMPVHMQEWGATYIAMPGHKGLYGPQGTGLLLCGEIGTPVLFGGTGSLSALTEMPDFLPDRLEAGTHNVPGIAGLLQGIRFVKEQGEGRILRHEQQLRHRMAQGLRSVPGVELFSTEREDAQSGVLSFRVAGMDCGEVGDYLSKQKIAVRTGLHCAPVAHKSAGSEETGTVRISFSVFNTLGQVDQVLQRIRTMVREGWN